MPIKSPSTFSPHVPRFGTNHRPSSPTTEYMKTIDHPRKDLQELTGQVNQWRFWQGNPPLGRDQIQLRRQQSGSDSPGNTHFPEPPRSESRNAFRRQLTFELRTMYPDAYMEHAVEVAKLLNYERQQKGKQPISAHHLPGLIRGGIEEANRLDRIQAGLEDEYGNPRSKR